MLLNNLDMAIAFTVVMLAVSLLVTILVQAISAVLALRGANLRWGLEELLRTVDPEFAKHEEQVKQIVTEVLQHPLISDSAISSQKWLDRVPLVSRYTSRLKLAKAVRIQELIGIFEMLGDPQPVASGAAATPKQRLAAIAAAGRAKLESPLVFAKNDLRSWFDTTMDRASQRFILHTRVWTVLFSIAIAFALHLDTFRLFSTFASNADVRAQVAGASDALQKIADRSLEPGAAGPSAGGPSPPARTPGARAVDLPALYRDAVARTPGIKADTVPGLFPDRPSAVEWLRTTYASQGRSAPEIETAIAGFNAAVDAGLPSDLDRLSDQALTVRGIMKTTGFQLVPDPYHSWDFSPWWPRSIRTVRPANLHFWGILFSAGFLGLGAPFWYNALKSLSALKPIVANKAEKDRGGR
jgi:hypothetical protein